MYKSTMKCVCLKATMFVDALRQQTRAKQRDIDICLHSRALSDCQTNSTRGSSHPRATKLAGNKKQITSYTIVRRFHVCSHKNLQRWSRSSWQDAYSIHRCSGSDLGVRGSVTCVDTSLHRVCTILVSTTSSFCVYVRATHSAPLHHCCSVLIGLVNP